MSARPDSDLSPALALSRSGALTLDATLGQLDCHACTVPASADGRKVDELLRTRPELPGVIVTLGAQPRVLSRQRWLEHLSRPFGVELYLTHPVERVVDALPDDALALPAATPVHQAAERALSRPRDALFEPLLVEFDDGNRRLLDAHVLLMAQSRIFALARERAEALRRDVEAYARELERTVADLRETQERLVEARRVAALARMVAGMAHEINTPVGVALTAVSHVEESLHALGASLAEGRLRRSELERFMATASESAALARGNVQRAADLVKSFKRVAVDGTSEARRQFDLAAYMGEVLLSLRPVLKRLPHRIRVDCPEGIVLDSFPGALAQVMTNLVMNAVEHAWAEGQAGNLVIACRTEGGMVEMRVTDDGRGIPAADMPHLFEPFFTTRGHAGGSGLGLHIVFNLVNGVLKGSVACDSAPGRGTSFTLRFPLVAGA